MPITRHCCRPPATQKRTHLGQLCDTALGLGRLGGAHLAEPRLCALARRVEVVGEGARDREQLAVAFDELRERAERHEARADDAGGVERGRVERAVRAVIDGDTAPVEALDLGGEHRELALLVGEALAQACREALLGGDRRAELGHARRELLRARDRLGVRRLQRRVRAARALKLGALAVDVGGAARRRDAEAVEVGLELLRAHALHAVRVRLVCGWCWGCSVFRVVWGGVRSDEGRGQG